MSLWPVWLGVLLGMIVLAAGITAAIIGLRALRDIGPVLDDMHDPDEKSAE